MRKIKFEKEEDNRWYAVLPEWIGDRAELEMVCGADVMLDILAQGKNYTSLTISDKEFDNQKYTLTLNREEADGGWYNLNGDNYDFEV